MFENRTHQNIRDEVSEEDDLPENQGTDGKTKGGAERCSQIAEYGKLARGGKTQEDQVQESRGDGGQKKGLKSRAKKKKKESSDRI